MKKRMFSQMVMAFSFSCLGFDMSLAAVETKVEECSRDLLLAYFPESFVKETIKKFHIPESEWDGIQRDLISKDKLIIQVVEEKASQMNPNPLKDPQARQAAVKLFRDTLLQVFSDVMKNHGVTDDKQIQSMLEDIQQQKAQRFAKCIQQENKGIDPEKPLKENTFKDSDD